MKRRMTRDSGWGGAGGAVIRMCRYHIGPSYIQGYNSWVRSPRNDHAVILKQQYKPTCIVWSRWMDTARFRKVSGLPLQDSNSTAHPVEKLWEQSSEYW